MNDDEGRWVYHPPETEVEFVCKDPAFARQRNHRPVKVTFKDEEYLGPGPTSRRVAVVDYNQQLDEVFEPAEVKADGSGYVVGCDPDFVSNIKLRQVAVWG